MEVLQTSALPLGDGALWSKLTDGQDNSRQSGTRPNSDTTRDADSGSSLQRSLSFPAGLRRGGPPSLNARLASSYGGQPSQSAHWLASRSRERSERLAKVGAGNGIRTRDFDLGKVALYH